MRLVVAEPTFDGVPRAAALFAITRNSYVVSARRPVTNRDSAFAPASVPNFRHTPGFASRYSTSKPVSSDETSVHVTRTEVAPTGAAATSTGGAGAPNAPTRAVSLGDDRPLARCFAYTRKSWLVPAARPVTRVVAAPAGASAPNVVQSSVRAGRCSTTNDVSSDEFTVH